jgi:hypothetical protein
VVALDNFLKIDSVDGGVGARHRGQLEAGAWSEDETRSGSPGGSFGRGGPSLWL